ncbi:phenazine biosynthesis FMN-dependent oxidase PhzG [Kitasatospora purpeofusca]|uniref:phenazine biosynthesis FMN-dependent oxidase PhzG n=1 Tax=Kitasatospora purpeofusca TaxID=67352 RepID=UPI0004C2716D|nr:phenazine biosynthesis FMN-dependent oxidase PhzG [Kitasatospora purpeofusca]
MSGTRSESMTGTVEVSFSEYGQPPAEPVGLLRAWLADAVRNGVREPRALTLATADGAGRPSTRIVVINQVTDTGFVFITHAGSRKGRDLAANPWASGLLYWRETSQQIVVDGPVVKLSDAAAEALWHARPVFTHAMSTASRQSERLGGLDEVGALRRRALELGAGQPLPRPEGFAGYELRFDGLEFWANGTDRLHERLRYDRDGDGWRVSRLQP